MLAPTGRDGPLVAELLGSARIEATVCASPTELVDRLRQGVGAAVIAEEALTPGVRDRLAAVLAQQPTWSDLPVLLLGGRGPASGRAGAAGDDPSGIDRSGVASDDPRDARPDAEESGRGLPANVVVLDRPLARRALLSAVRGALRNRRRQYETRQLLGRLGDGVRQRDRFLAMLGHELRNPLAAIKAAHEVLRSGGSGGEFGGGANGGASTGHPSGESQAEYQRLIGRQVELLVRLVNDLLDVSRVRSGKVVLKRRLVDLVEVAERCRESVASAAATRGQTLALRIVGAEGAEREVGAAGGHEPVVVLGDPERLEQVVTNLLTNAIKYTPEGGRIELAVGRETGRPAEGTPDGGGAGPAGAGGSGGSGAGEGAGAGAGAGADDGGRTARVGRDSRSARAFLRVSDDGIGMTPGVLAGVFDLFSQADESLDRSQGGLGLGLSLVRSLIEGHHGSVSAHSDGPGTGSTFVVRLPVKGRGATAEPEGDPPGPRVGGAGRGDSAASPRPGERGEGSRRVLLVEDQADTRAVMARLIRGWGHAVATAVDGPSALVAALDPPGGERPEVALVDVGLPGLDGYEVARRLRAAEATAPAGATGESAGPPMRLVALTGYGQPEDARRSRAAGFDLHLVKPVDFARLRRVLNGGE